MAEVYGEDPPIDATREEQLMSMWWRLAMVDGIYHGVSTYGSQSSLTSLKDEIMAIAKGDKATLLAERAHVLGPPGQRLATG